MNKASSDYETKEFQARPDPETITVHLADLVEQSRPDPPVRTPPPEVETGDE